LVKEVRKIKSVKIRKKMEIIMIEGEKVRKFLVGEVNCCKL